MKRIAAAIICIVLFVMAPCAALASDTPNTLSENEAMYDSPRDVAISFLNDCAYEMFMYESKGLSNKTVLMLSNNDLVTANARFLSEFANRPASFDYWSISSVNFQNSLESSMDFVLNKVSYFKTIRADQNITRKNFETQYTVKKAVQEGDFCTIYINEFISFQYYDTYNGIKLRDSFISISVDADGITGIVDSWKERTISAIPASMVTRENMISASAASEVALQHAESFNYADIEPEVNGDLSYVPVGDNVYQLCYELTTTDGIVFISVLDGAIIEPAI